MEKFVPYEWKDGELMCLAYGISLRKELSRAEFEELFGNEDGNED